MQDQNVDCEVELDDFLIHANSYEKCKKDVELIVSLFSYFGFKINFSKSCITLSQKINFVGYTLDAVNRCFTLTQEKLVKCRLIIKALSLLTSIKVKLLQCILGFLNFACQLVPLIGFFIWPWYRFANLPASYQVRPDPGSLVHLWEIFFKGPLFYAWPSRVARRSVTCFVDATISRVAGISGHRMFPLPLRSLRPIFEAEFLASLYEIYSHLPFSNNVCLIGDNTGVLYSLQKGSSRNLISNCFLQNLADLWHKYMFYLNLWYVPSNSNPADFSHIIIRLFANFSGQGMFSLPVRSSHPIFEAEFLASLYRIYSHLPFIKLQCQVQYLQRRIAQSEKPKQQPRSKQTDNSFHESPHNQNKQQSVVILGDSMVYYQDERKHSSARRIVKVRSFPGATQLSCSTFVNHLQERNLML